MNYTEYTFSTYDSRTGINKVSKYFDYPPVDYLEYKCNKGNYIFNSLDFKNMVHNYLNDNKSKIIDILDNYERKPECQDIYNHLIEYNFNSNKKEDLLEFLEMLLDRWQIYPNVNQLLFLITQKNKEVLELLNKHKTRLEFNKIGFYEYKKLVSKLNEDCLKTLENWGFERNPDYETTIKVLKDNKNYDYISPDFPFRLLM